MFREFCACSLLLCSTSGFAQQVTVEVWQLEYQNQPPVPARNADLRIARAANLRFAPSIPMSRPTASGPQQNQYVLNAAGLGSLVDVTILNPGCHAWTVRDLLVGQGGDQKVIVQAFKYDYPIKAPECFALKTQYELLFRNEQLRVLREQGQAPPGQRLSADDMHRLVQRRARLLYGDALLALPNPDRADRQPTWVRAMLDEMERDEALLPENYNYNELDGMISGLFKQYDMYAFGQNAPSVWQTTYQSPNGPVPSEVRIYGTYGTYSTNDGGLHDLTGIDIVEQYSDDGDGGIMITGTWKFQNGASGPFRWKIDETGEGFQGTWQFANENVSRSWTGRRIEIDPSQIVIPGPPGTETTPPLPAN